MTLAKGVDNGGGGVFTLHVDTTKQQLLRLLHPDVDAHVAELVAEGKSWRHIADAVAARAGITVSHESLRKWYGDAS
jgi:intein-encoded DNA endonuclease-like protein